MENQLRNSKICEKLTNYFIEIQKYLDTTPTYSIAESRKSLEYICKSIFGLENLKIPVNKKGYSTIASLIYHLNKKKIIDPITHATMQVIRCNGNEASHDSDIDVTRDDAYLVHQHLSRLIIWFTEKYGLKNCKVCTLATNEKNSFVQKQKTFTTITSMRNTEKFLKLTKKLSQSKKFGIMRILKELTNDIYVKEKIINSPSSPSAIGAIAGSTLFPGLYLFYYMNKESIIELRDYLTVKYGFNDN